jgi:hypothetical protein
MRKASKNFGQGDQTGQTFGFGAVYFAGIKMRFCNVMLSRSGGISIKILKQVQDDG